MPATGSFRRAWCAGRCGRWWCSVPAGAGRGGGVRDDAEVEVGAGKGGRGERVLGHGDDGAEPCAARGGAGVEVEGADLAVVLGEGPVGGIVEGEMVGGVVEGMGMLPASVCATRQRTSRERSDDKQERPKVWQFHRKETPLRVVDAKGKETHRVRICAIAYRCFPPLPPPPLPSLGSSY